MTSIPAIATYPSPFGAALPSGLPKVEFVDVDFTSVSAASVLETLKERDAASPFAYVVTPNVDHVVRLQHKRSDLWPAYRGAWMTLCDSRILARLARTPESDLAVVPGSDLTACMFDEIVDADDSIAIVGGSTALIEQLCRRYGLKDVKHFNPPMGFIKNELEVARVVRFVIEAKARYTFFAIGSPQQEIVAYRTARTGLATGIGFCIGASLDFLAGAQSRAPRLVQRMSLEWLYRLGSNPRRLWRRYLVEGPEIFQIARQWRRSHALAPSTQVH